MMATPRPEEGQVYRILDSSTQFTYALITGVDPLTFREESTLKRLVGYQIPRIHVTYRETWNRLIQTGEKLYLVCRQCGEAFDDIRIAHDHKPGDCGSSQGWDILPESEAM